MKIKKSFAAFGVCMALVGTLCASLHGTEKRAEALVLVQDPANIAEAVKIVTNTLDILSAEQQQIVLQMLNMKKLDEGSLHLLWRAVKTDKAFAEQLAAGEAGEYGNALYTVDGILSGRRSVPTTWNEILGSVTDIFDGQKNPGGCFGTGKPGLVLMDQVMKDTVTMAKASQVRDVESAKTVADAVEKSYAAEGNLQAVQAGNTILAAQAQTLEHGNQMLANLSAAIAVQYQRENLERARTLQAAQNTAEYCGKFAAALPTYEE